MGKFNNIFDLLKLLLLDAEYFYVHLEKYVPVDSRPYKPSCNYLKEYLKDFWKEFVRLYLKLIFGQLLLGTFSTLVKLL